MRYCIIHTWGICSFGEFDMFINVLSDEDERYLVGYAYWTWDQLREARITYASCVG